MGALTATALRQADNGASYLDRNPRMKLSTRPLTPPTLHQGRDLVLFGFVFLFCNNLSVDLEGTGLKEDKPIILDVTVFLPP